MARAKIRRPRPTRSVTPRIVLTSRQQEAADAMQAYAEHALKKFPFENVPTNEGTAQNPTKSHLVVMERRGTQNTRSLELSYQLNSRLVRLVADPDADVQELDMLIENVDELDKDGCFDHSCGHASVTECIELDRASRV